MDKYIFTYVDEDREGIFRDLTSEEAKKIIDFLPSHKRYTISLLNKAEKLCLSYQLNSKFQVPFQSVFYNLDAYKYESQHTYHMIMPTTSISKFTVQYLKTFKKKHSNVKLYALVTDSMHASSPHMNLVREKLFSDVWDRVLTYDKYDAEEYGFTWFGYSYYSSYDFVEPDPVESDIYYVGYDKGGRENLVKEIFRNLQKNQCNCRFDVVASQTSMKDSSFVYMEEKISYPQVVSRVKSSNCILEILQENQESQSIRYFEAIIYNRKLLTNNRHIQELPYYDARYMKYFNSIADIDFEWVRNKDNIDYQYDGRFSPLRIVDYIAGIQ